MQIRDATDADWPSIYPIFRDIVEAGQTYAYPEGMSLEQAHDLWMADHVVVATEDGLILGSAKMGPNRPGRGAHIATASFMVDPTTQGRGVGWALGNYLVEWAGKAGFHGIQFNAVVETNAPAVHLWQALGFTIIGTVPEAFDHREHGLVGLHVMYRPLAEQSMIGS